MRKKIIAKRRIAADGTGTVTSVLRAFCKIYNSYNNDKKLLHIYSNYKCLFLDRNHESWMQTVTKRSLLLKENLIENGTFMIKSLKTSNRISNSMLAANDYLSLSI